jgi:hypothetical protein
MLGSILCGPLALVIREYPRSPVLSIHLWNVLLYRFKTTDVAVVMDHDSPSSSSSSDFETEDDQSSDSLMPTSRGSSASGTRRSMRGLQIAISEGWLVQRARDMCSFAHDRYRQAAEAEAFNLPHDLIAKMSFRVRVFLIPPIDGNRLAF